MNIWIYVVMACLAVGGMCGYADNYKNNWYVLVDTSRYIFNYRHFSNVLGIYRQLKNNGIKDDRIIVFAPLTYACDPRNRKPGEMFYQSLDEIKDKSIKRESIYCEDTLVDIRGEDFSDIRAINIIKGFYQQFEPLNQRLLSDENSDIVFYFTGHSGDEFFKIQDSQVLYARDIAVALDIAFKKKKYKRILFLSDTCEAFSWFNYVKAPNVIYQASSGLGESAHSHGWDTELHRFTSDKYSYLFINYLSTTFKSSYQNLKIKDFFGSFDKNFLSASPADDNTLTNSTIFRESFLSFFPPPIPESSSSIFERVKHSSSKELFSASADFINSIQS